MPQEPSQDTGMSYEDLMDLRQVRNALPKGDPRIAKVDSLIKASAPGVQAQIKKNTDAEVSRVTGHGGLDLRTEQLRREAQRQKYLSEGPESQGKGVLPRLGHELLSLVPETAAMATSTMAGMMEPKNAVAAASGALNPAIPAIYFGAKGAADIPDATKDMKTPEGAQRLLTDLSMVTGGLGGAGSSHATPAGSQLLDMGKEKVGTVTRNYAEKVSRQMTNLPPEKDTGINVPGRVAEATRKITTLKNASEVYGVKATEATKAVEMKAVEAKQHGVYLTPQETTAVYTWMDKLMKRSGSLKAMQDFQQLKSPLWSGQRPPYIDPVQMLELRRDLDEIVNYDTKGGKRTPTANAAHDVRTALDQTLDKKVPGWKDLNEQSSARIKASKALEERHQESFGQYVSGGVRDIITHPISSGASFLAAYEAASAVPGMPHIGKWMAAVGASGVTRFLYDSLPSQTARIMMADSIADTLIGKRAPKGPSNYPPTGAPGGALPAPKPPIQGGPGQIPVTYQLPAGQPPATQAPQTGGAPTQAPASQPPQPQQVNDLIMESFKRAAKAAGKSDAEINDLIQRGFAQAKKGPGAANFDDPSFSVKRSVDFNRLGTYDVTLNGRKYQISRDPESGFWYEETTDNKHFSERLLGFNKKEAIENLKNRSFNER